MLDRRALFRVTQQYARTLLGAYEIGDVLNRLSDDIAMVLGIDGAGVSVADAAGHLQAVGATDASVADVERHQVEVGEGPCHESYKAGQPVHSADLQAEERWPGYTRYVQRHGWRGVAGIPMTAGDTCIGAIDLYHRQPRPWPDEDLEAAQLLADMASGYIVNAYRYSQKARLAEQLQHALDSRIVIEQAKGVLAERAGIDPETAFDVIRKYSRSSRIKIHDAARDVIDGRALLH